jgi:hypothetical protein
METGEGTAKLADQDAAMSDTSLPLDENLWALIASDLSIHDLGRLACVEAWFSLPTGYCGSCHNVLPCSCNVNEIQFGMLGLSPPHDAQL